MKTKRRIVYLIGLISVLSLLISLFLFVYAIEQIYQEKAEEQRLLDEWEEIASGEFADLAIDQLIVSTANVRENSPSDRTSNSTIPINTVDSSEQPTTVIGKISIPDISGKWPIMAGVGKKELSQGMGHYTGSAEFGQQGNAIIAGHRERGLLKLDSLEIGAEIIVETQEGKFVYHVSEKKIVDKEDRSVHIESDDNQLTLITCYPLVSFGPNDERYIVAATMSP